MKYILSFILLLTVLIVQHSTCFAQSQVSVTINSEIDTSKRPLFFKCAIDSLSIGESMCYKWISSGCFHQLEDSILVLRTPSGFTLTHNKKRKAISGVQANVIRDFEYNIFKVSKTVGGCTTTERYIYKRQGKTYTAGRDGTCKYDFFTDLLTTLGI